MPLLNSIFAFVFWTLLAVYLNLFAPSTSYIIGGFLGILLCALYTTFRSFRTPLLLSLVISLFLVTLVCLQLFQLLNLLNFGLLLALLMTIRSRLLSSNK